MLISAADHIPPDTSSPFHSKQQFKLEHINEGVANLIGKKWQEKHLRERKKEELYSLQSIFLKLAWLDAVLTRHFPKSMWSKVHSWKFTIVDA